MDWFSKASRSSSPSAHAAQCSQDFMQPTKVCSEPSVGPGKWYGGLASIVTSLTLNPPACPSCPVHQPSQQKEPFAADPLPHHVFDVASAYFFSHAGRNYLICANRLSGWMEISELSSTAARPTIRNLGSYFSRLGIPTTLSPYRRWPALHKP